MPAAVGEIGPVGNEQGTSHRNLCSSEFITPKAQTVLDQEDFVPMLTSRGLWRATCRQTLPAGPIDQEIRWAHSSWLWLESRSRVMNYANWQIMSDGCGEAVVEATLVVLAQDGASSGCRRTSIDRQRLMVLVKCEPPQKPTTISCVCSALTSKPTRFTIPGSCQGSRLLPGNAKATDKADAEIRSRSFVASASKTESKGQDQRGRERKGEAARP